jgi:hypothetical protein
MYMCFASVHKAERIILLTLETSFAMLILFRVARI